MAATSTLEEALPVAALLHRSVLSLSRRLRAAHDTSRLSSSRLSVMSLLRRGGPSSPSALAQRLQVQPQSLSRLLNDLEARRFVSRSIDHEDRRRNLVTLTAEGLGALVSEAEERRTMLAEAIVRELTGTERELAGLAAGLIDRLANSLPPEDQVREI